MNEDPDPTFHFDANPDPITHQSDANLRPLRLYSAVSVHGPQPLKLLNFDFNEDPDSAFHNNADPDPAFLFIPDLASQNNEDSSPQLCFAGHVNKLYPRFRPYTVN